MAQYPSVNVDATLHTVHLYELFAFNSWQVYILLFTNVTLPFANIYKLNNASTVHFNVLEKQIEIERDKYNIFQICFRSQCGTSFNVEVEFNRKN